MGEIYKTAASLRIMGDELDPEKITELIGKAPSSVRKKGAPFNTPNGKQLIARTGSWSISAETKSPGDIDSQVTEILEGTTSNMAVWLELSKKFKVEIFGGFFLGDYNEGLTISSKTMLLLGERGIQLDMDIYGAN
ncbi:DUF4279 domain-containing protein [Cohaesibacter gelatinilyticus]|uniref:DUF4279 domain-containing protein n=1 Tax=Cohaesibacter gelatinilyticus TaxID=372072 RepID=A0A285PDR5_9HYPH|nr:DUF4279 domain-containing protein [Cohaesibacter gelatinilyticus]SNZ19373.1 protein of unknown function [Cohaesibacter gelatinilyticus]